MPGNLRKPTLPNVPQDRSWREQTRTTRGYVIIRDGTPKVAAALSDRTWTPGRSWAVSALFAHEVDWPNLSDHVTALLSETSETSAQMMVAVAQREPDIISRRARQSLGSGLITRTIRLRQGRRRRGRCLRGGRSASRPCVNPSSGQRYFRFCGALCKGLRHGGSVLFGFSLTGYMV